MRRVPVGSRTTRKAATNSLFDPHLSVRHRPLADLGHPRDLDGLDLPISEIDRRALPQEVHQSHEMVAIAAPDHRADDPLQGTGQDPHLAPHHMCRFGDDREARGKHLIELAQVLLHGPLIRHLEDVRQVVPLQGLDALVVIAIEEQVPREEREQGPDLPPAGVRLSWTTWGR